MAEKSQRNPINSVRYAGHGSAREKKQLRAKRKKKKSILQLKQVLDSLFQSIEDEGTADVDSTHSDDQRTDENNPNLGNNVTIHQRNGSTVIGEGSNLSEASVQNQQEGDSFTDHNDVDTADTRNRTDGGMNRSDDDSEDGRRGNYRHDNSEGYTDSDYSSDESSNTSNDETNYFQGENSSETLEGMRDIPEFNEAEFDALGTDHEKKRFVAKYVRLRARNMIHNKRRRLNNLFEEPEHDMFLVPRTVAQLEETHQEEIVAVGKEFRSKQEIHLAICEYAQKRSIKLKYSKGGCTKNWLRAIGLFNDHSDENKEKMLIIRAKRTDCITHACWKITAVEDNDDPKERDVMWINVEKRKTKSIYDHKQLSNVLVPAILRTSKKNITAKEARNILQPYVKERLSDSMIHMARKYASKLIFGSPKRNVRLVPALVDAINRNASTAAVYNTSDKEAMKKIIYNNAKQEYESAQKKISRNQRVPWHLYKVDKPVQYPEELENAPHDAKFLTVLGFCLKQIGCKFYLKFCTFDGAQVGNKRGRAGTILILCQYTSNKNMVPVVFYWTAANESAKAWNAFFTFLLKHLPHIDKPDYVFVADADKGIDKAFRENFKRAFFFEDSMHRGDNIGKRTDSKVKKHYWDLVKHSPNEEYYGRNLDLMNQYLNLRVNHKKKQYMAKFDENRLYPYACVNQNIEYTDDEVQQRQIYALRQQAAKRRLLELEKIRCNPEATENDIQDAEAALQAANEALNDVELVEYTIKMFSYISSQGIESINASIVNERTREGSGAFDPFWLIFESYNKQRVRYEKMKLEANLRTAVLPPKLCDWLDSQIKLAQEECVSIRTIRDDIEDEICEVETARGDFETITVNRNMKSISCSHEDKRINCFLCSHEIYTLQKLSQSLHDYVDKVWYSCNWKNQFLGIYPSISFQMLTDKLSRDPVYAAETRKLHPVYAYPRSKGRPVEPSRFPSYATEQGRSRRTRRCKICSSVEHDKRTCPNSR